MIRRVALLVLTLWFSAAMAADHPPPTPPPRVEYHGLAIVNRVEPIIGLINITHGDVPKAGWSTMTRDLRLKPKELAAGLRPGMSIRFQLTAVDPLTWVITALEPIR